MLKLFEASFLHVVIRSGLTGRKVLAPIFDICPQMSLDGYGMIWLCDSAHSAGAAAVCFIAAFCKSMHSNSQHVEVMSCHCSACGP